MAGMSSHARAWSRFQHEEHDDAVFKTGVWRRAWSFARPYRRLIGLNLFTLVAATGFAVLPPLVFKYLIDRAIPEQSFSMVNWLFAAAISLALINTGLGLLNRWFSAIVGESLIFDLRCRLYEHVQRMPLAFFTRTQTGSLMSRLNNDVVGAQATVTTAATVVSDVLTLLVTLTAMLVLSWKVTALALLILPIFLLLDRLVGKRLARLSRQRMQANADMSTNMQERFNVSGAVLVKLFGRPAQESAVFAGHAGRVRRLGVHQAMLSRVYFGALALAGTLGTAIVYWLGARSVINEELTIGTLTALAVYVTRLYDPLTGIASARVDLLNALVSFQRCFEVLDAPIAIDEAPDAKKLETPRGEVVFDHVWFRYPAPASVTIPSLDVVATNTEHDDEPSDWILEDVSLHAEPGQMVALVGHSGAGKTTLSTLLSRLYDVNEGAVRIDGHDVRTLTLQSLHDAIGVVSQDTHLFHDSIEANLRYAKPDATYDEMVAACAGARISAVIDSLPDGYNTIVGERGYRLSGGEKQRLAIARVLLKQPAIVVLDEATAHLDSETEALVQQALREALTGRTAFVIAHRLATIRAADKILVIDGGEIVQQGSHDELVNAGGLYDDLYRTQFSTAD
jgi:ATP-binding cassette subfamily B protein